MNLRPHARCIGLNSGEKLARDLRIFPGDRKVATEKLRDGLGDRRYRIGEISRSVTNSKHVSI